MTEPVSSRPKVFISYSHADEDWKDRLQKHLSVVAREEDFDIWEDRKIEPGSEWYETIVRQIEEAGIAILLISVDFLSSDFIRNEEVKRFLDRREKKDGLRIYPVIVHECLWKRVARLSRLQVRPKDGQALSQWDGHRLNQELTKITDEIAQILETAPKPARHSRQDQFLAAFRCRFAPEYSRWDLGTVGVTQSGGASRPIEADLDLMYLPLRLAKHFDISETDRGSLLLPEELLNRKEPLVVRGPAGAGKTTWIRWTFRQLLRMGSALPLMLVLRDLAFRWQDRSREGADRSLDTFLECWIAEHMGGGWEGVLPEFLAQEGGPRPVLLVDGWDELGPLGDELREKLLGFLSQYPRVLVVVTSRPYGEGRPSHADRFEVLDIQPLSDGEIAEFTTRFFTHCHGGEQSAVQRGAGHFQKALKSSPDAQVLARTALLLTMMLLISRSRPLPDKRHLLYDACIENLLTALPNRKEQEGALLGRERWRPPDSEERMRVVAALAAGLQEEGYKETRTRSAIVHSWEEMAAILPSEWPEKRKLDFLAWLAGPAGLLTDRTDGKLSFTHLSFQEYLTAWRLNAQVEGPEERIETFRRLLSNQIWWETLRLWAALIEKQSRERLDLVLKALIDVGDDSLTLAGAILADGLGTEERFRNWLDEFTQALCTTWPSGCDLCARAWSSSRQQERKEELVRPLNETASSQTWLAWLRYEEFAELASLAWNSLQPTQGAARILIEQINGATASCAADVAFGRLLVTGSPIWPINPVELGLLQTWLSNRRLIGLSLQLASTSGATQLDLLRFFRLLRHERMDRSESIRDWTSNLARVMADDMALGSAFIFPQHAKARDLARDWASTMARDWARHSTGDWDQNRARGLARYIVIDLGTWTRNVACALVRASARDLARNWARNRGHRWAQYLSESLTPETPWTQEFSLVDLFSFRRVDARASLAYADEKIPLFSLFSQASWLSLHPEQDSSALEQSLAQLTPTLDPLWPALARHLARRPTPEDRALLIDLAQHPEKRELPLSWGLQFIVRGDVMLRDESVLTLDELADKAGLPRLPYLEDMPDELEVDWDGIIQPS